MSEFKINFINASYRRFWKRHKKEILSVINKCGSKGEFILREEVSKLERSLAEYCGVKYAIGVGSGTDALFLSLKALGIGIGDEVITVGNCFIAPIQAIYHTGATPVLVDVGADGLMNMDCIRKTITPFTKVIIPVHLSGKVCDMETLRKIIQNTDIKIVEDTCQALGARTGNWGDIGCLSFNTPKLLGGIGDGGMCLTNNKQLAEKLFLLRNHWNIYQGSVRKEDFPQPGKMGWGFKSRLDNIQAAFLNVKFKYYPEMLARRKEIAEMYNLGIKNSKILKPVQQKNQVYQEYILMVDDIKKFCKYVQSKGIETLVRDTTPNHKLKGYEVLDCELLETEFQAQHQVRLPIYPELRDNEIKYIIKAINNYV